MAVRRHLAHASAASAGFELTATAKEGYVDFRGGRLPERFTSSGHPSGCGRYVAMGGGDTRTRPTDWASRTETDGEGRRRPRPHPAQPSASRGHGQTRRARVIGIGPGGGKSIASTRGFEDLTLGARYADVRGSRGGEQITVVACRATSAHGRAGTS